MGVPSTDLPSRDPSGATGVPKRESSRSSTSLELILATTFAEGLCACSKSMLMPERHRDCSLFDEPLRDGCGVCIGAWLCWSYLRELCPSLRDDFWDADPPAMPWRFRALTVAAAGVSAPALGWSGEGVEETEEDAAAAARSAAYSGLSDAPENVPRERRTGRRCLPAPVLATPSLQVPPLLVPLSRLDVAPGEARAGPRWRVDAFARYGCTVLMPMIPLLWSELLPPTGETPGRLCRNLLSDPRRDSAPAHHGIERFRQSGSGRETIYDIDSNERW